MWLRLTILALSCLSGLLAVRPLPLLLRALGLERTNYAGNPIGSGAGLLFVLSALPWLWLTRDRQGLPAVVAVLGFGLLGCIDDRWGTAEFKGLRGHFRALRGGRVTTGLVKAVGGGLLACGLAWGIRPSPASVLSAALIALMANALNLLDLRPLRTLKAFWLCGLPLLAGAPPVLAQLLGLSVPYAGLEARRRVMLGDTGSNALGGLLGVCACLTLPWWGQGLGVLALLAFHAWAERHSLSRWIDAHPWAAAIDGWGWRPSVK